ncbi:MAG TPA: TlpA disulfide reductase family protein [Pyrinomonadaceae bacterium]|nr:TlpA disulfide reductase family protein [Pyrinomonadaceae bacterium]
MPNRTLNSARALCLLLAALAPASAQTPPASRQTRDAAKSEPVKNGKSDSATGEQDSTAKPAPAKPQADSAKPAFQVTQLDEAGLAKLLGRDAATTNAERRPLLVNFWATWCDPCREEMPDLVKIDDDFRPRGLDFALVSLDDAEEISKGVPEFLTHMRATRIPSYLLNANDPEAAITSVDPAWRGELPATFLFDRQGRLAFKHTGRIKPAELRKAIEATLAAPPATTTP